MPKVPIKNIVSDLHAASASYQFAVAAEKLRQLIQLAKMTEPMLLQVITPEEEQTASAFWWAVFGAKFPTSRETIVKSAHAYYAVVYCAGNNERMFSMREQARQYCERIAEVCAKILQKPEEEQKRLLPPRGKSSAILTVVDGGRQ